MKTYIIAEAACTWLHAGLEGAAKSIKLAASCGASAWKTQWTSDHVAMEARRGAAPGAYQRLSWPAPHHAVFKALCDEAGIDYLCTVFLPKDACIIHPYIKRGKISAFESHDREMVQALYAHVKDIIISYNTNAPRGYGSGGFTSLYCVSKYPTPIEALGLSAMVSQGDERRYDGLSDHTTSVLTGAVAVGAGATILEKHVMTHDTPHDDPDYGHSLILDTQNKEFSFRQYVQNVRDAEKMMYGS